jgi:hypothetical protein
MNDETDDLEQPEGDILTYTVSDEAPEAAAQTSRGDGTIHGMFIFQLPETST